MTKSTSLRSLGKNTALYGVAGVVARVVGVLMLPVYTHYLTPAQYGLLALLDTTVEITSILFAAGTRAGLQRFFFKADTELERKRVVFTTWVLELGLSSAGALALMAAAPFVYRHVLVGAGNPGLIRIAALNFALAAASGAPLVFLQIEQRATAFTVVLIGKLALQVTLNVVFLAWFHLGVASILWSTTISSAVVGVILGAYLMSRTGIHVSREVARNIRRFGVPYQITTAAAFILAFGDRFFLARYQNESVVGIYGLAYQFGFLLYQLCTTPFLRAWDPQRFQMVTHGVAERDASYARGFLYFNLLLVTTAMGISVFVRPVIYILTSPSYHSAAALVPLVLVAYVIQSWGDATKFGIDVSERTRLFTYASWIATAVVIALYAILIPPFAGIGAVVATIIAFVVRFVLGYRFSQRLWPVRYGWAPVLRLSAVAALVVAVDFIWVPAGIIGQFAEGVGLTAAYGVLAWAFVVPATERMSLIEVIRAHSFAAVLKRA